MVVEQKQPRPPRTRESVEGCPVFIAAQVLGKKWSILILQEMMFPEAKDGLRFSEIQRDLDWITPKVLSQRLSELKEMGIISRTVDPDMIPPSVTYKLTEKGMGLRDAIVAMQNWGRDHGHEVNDDCEGDNFVGCHDCRAHDI
ncbi:MAG: helix-turn-helix transcriptional regulator [Candidatus Thorarchaeota archaeon]|nr:MAG: helix-turn-helix transcriptional regulator [Candidatus Thorarchaeota archaeon]